MHGIYTEKISLDIELCKKISEETNLPLVLHGGSGIDEKNLKEAIKAGVVERFFATGNIIFLDDFDSIFSILSMEHCLNAVHKIACCS